MTHRTVRTALALAGAATLAVLPAAQATAAPAAAAAVTTRLWCGDGQIYVEASGTGFPANTPIQVTRTTYWLMGDGTRMFEESLTTGHTTRSNGAFIAPSEHLADSWSWAESTVRDTKGRVLATSPVADITCPIW